jgi:hypothetical protein
MSIKSQEKELVSCNLNESKQKHLMEVTKKMQAIVKIRANLLKAIRLSRKH